MGLKGVPEGSGPAGSGAFSQRPVGDRTHFAAFAPGVGPGPVPRHLDKHRDSIASALKVYASVAGQVELVPKVECPGGGSNPTNRRKEGCHEPKCVTV
jgi:hypothetical protein